jgi:WD40 repeat protein
VLQRFVPALDTRNMDVAISPDGSQVAAVGDVNTSDDSDTTGGIFLWNAVSGQLVHRLPASRFKNFGFLLPSAGLRYSPDGKHLAVIFPFRVVVIDVATGEIAASLRSSGGTASVQWSTNGDRITAVSVVSLGTGPGGVEFDVYPSVKEWGWRSGELVRTMTSPAP